MQSVLASEVLVFLNTLFSILDRLTDVYGVHKVIFYTRFFILVGS